ncbi:RuvX/YqgF family protein [Pseudothermotoga sp.]
MRAKLIAVDYGEKRCGIAIGENVPSRIFTVERSKVFDVLLQSDASTIVVGIPLSMSGRYSQQTFECIAFAEKIRRKIRKEVFLVDERLSSKMFQGRKNVDGLSAAEIFERFVAQGAGVYQLREPEKVSDATIEEVQSYPGKLLIAHLSDTRLCRENCVVLQKEPYYAYLFQKKGCHVERDERLLEQFAPFDIIVTRRGSNLERLLKLGGKMLCL